MDPSHPRDKVTEAHGEADAALEYLVQEREGTATMTSEDEKKLVRKIDWMIVPLMFCCYNMQFLDKTLLNYVAVMGIYEDANIMTSQFSLLIALFYVSLLTFELPTGYAMQRLLSAKYLGVNVICFGVCVSATAACKSFASLAITRILLGCFESCVTPAMILFSAMWYKKHEQVARIGLWYCGIGTASIIGAVASFGFQHYTAKTFTSWQIMFLILGVITVAVGICVVLFMPDNPMTSRLRKEEKVWVIERLRVNHTGIENKHFKPRQAIECFKDPHTWLLSLITTISSIPNGATTAFQATLIKSFGFDSKQTALLSIPSGVTTIISVLFAMYVAGRPNQRSTAICLTLLPGVLGGCLLAFLPTNAKVGKLIGCYLTSCISGSLPIIYSWAAANYAGHSKKVTMNAVLLMSFCAGSIIGPETFQGKDAPDFLPAKITVIVTASMTIVLTLFLRSILARENQRRDRLDMGSSHKENQEFLDLTDRANHEFRYQL